MFISIQGLQLYGFHGCSSEEQTLGHAYEVDVCMTLPDSIGDQDELEHTVDYGKIASISSEAFSESKCKLIERVATKIASALLDKLVFASEVTVTVRKLHPPVPFVIRSAEASITLKR